MSELDTITADLKWMRKNMEQHDQLMLEVFERLRSIENDLATMKANQKPPMNGWAVLGIVVSVAATLLVILDRIYVNQ
jgi:hypothetical protein